MLSYDGCRQIPRDYLSSLPRDPHTSDVQETQHSRKKKKQATPFEEPCSFAVSVTSIMMSQTLKLPLILVVSKPLPNMATRVSSQSCVVHIIDAISKAQRYVTRSTFSSELLSASDTVDHGMLLALSLHEFIAGAQSATEAKTLRETGGWNVRLSLYVDAMSVYAAVTATFIKIPAEKSLLSHIQYIRGLLDTKVLEALVWLDTRDVVADGLTKGSVDRDALHACMNGIGLLQHSAQSWSTNKMPPSSPFPRQCMNYESLAISAQTLELSTSPTIRRLAPWRSPLAPG